MSTFNTTYKEYSFAQHGEVYTILEEVFTSFGIAYYLVGANARDVQLYKAGIKPTRGTADIDFAIMVPDFEVYDALFDALLNHGFRKVSENYRMIYDKTNTVIDFMPYGEIEQDYTVTFIERNLTLSVLGFREVGEKAEIFTPEGESYSLPVSPIEGIMILKLVAWNDKPDSRIKDLEDISFLLKNGWEIYENEAYENHLDLFDENFEQTKAAAQIIGRKMKPILELNTKLKETIITILENAIKEKTKSENLEIVFARNLDKTIEETKSILTLLLKGINDK